MDQVIDSFLIDRVTATKIISLRHEALRAGYPRYTAHFDGDNDKHTHHFAVIEGGNVVSCVSFYLSDYEHRLAWQMAGLATTTTMRGQGFGTRLLNHAQQYFNASPEYGHVGTLWCHARGPEIWFLERRHWQKVSEPYKLLPWGLHYRMMTRLM